MQRKPKPIIIAVVIVLCGIALGAFLWPETKTRPATEQQDQQDKTPIAPTGAAKNDPPPPAPTVTLIYDAPKDVVFRYTQVPEGLPESLPIYAVSGTTRGTNTAASYAASYRLPQKDDFVSFSGIRTTSWHTGEAAVSHSINGAIQTLSIKHMAPTSPIHQSADRAVSDFFNLLPSLPTGFSLSTPVTSNVPLDGNAYFTDKDAISLISYAYTLLLHGIPVSFSNFTSSGRTIWVDGSGRLRTAEVALVPDTVIQSKTVPVLSATKVLTALNTGRGLLIYSADQGSDWGTPPKFNRVDVTSVAPMYYLDTAKSMLVPAFSIRGTGLSAVGEKQDVQYFLLGYPEGAL